MKTVFALFFCLLSHFSWCQNPQIEVRNNNGKFSTSELVVLDSWKTEVKIMGGISTTVSTLVFKNNSNRSLEGKVTFPLPEGVSVSGYAIDINGKMRKAVPIEKERAKEVFESIEKRKIDPGIMEKVEGNNFRTRIYPIHPKGSRTLQITYSTPLKRHSEKSEFSLPLEFNRSISEFSLSIKVFDNVHRPKLVENLDGKFGFTKIGNEWNVTIQKKNFMPKNTVTVSIPKESSGVQTSVQKASQNSFYFLSNIEIVKSPRIKKLPSEIALVWDNSLSRLQQNHDKEFDLLESYFKRIESANVHVYFLNATFEKAKKFDVTQGNIQELKDYLSTLDYDGGTDFSKLERIEEEEEILFFTDGISSFGDLDLKWTAPTYTICVASRANYSLLQHISTKTGGEFINLNEKDVSSATEQMLYQPYRFLGIKEKNGTSEVYPSSPRSIGSTIILTGLVDANCKTITALFGYGNKVDQQKTISIDTNSASEADWNLSTFWAQNKISDLEVSETDRTEEIKNLGKEFGIVTATTSLIVLENLADYIKYQISPPEEFLNAYSEILKEKNERINEERINLTQDAEIMMENLKLWWSKDFLIGNSTEKRKSDEETVEGAHNRTLPSRSPVVATASTRASSDPLASVVHGRVSGVIVSDSTELGNIEEVVINAMGLRKSLELHSASTSIVTGKINVQEIASTETYMKFFTGKDAKGIYREYLKKRKLFGEMPRFYFDVAQLLFSKKNTDLGMKVLSSIADLDLENEELFKLLAYKLKQAGAYDKEVWVCKKIVKWRPFDPQSYRDYALALEDNGQHQEALDALYTIFTKSYSAEMGQRDEGIEEIVLMELNEMISRYRNKLTVSNINPKLIADLPIDIRVVLNWNKDNTDIDLWVTDPTNEKCFYSNKFTKLGGRISNDFTEGFGPEQFLLKKATKGKFKIETNFFGERQVSNFGPTALMAEIYLNYGSGKQERKIVVFQNEKPKESSTSEGIFVAEFEF